MNSNLNIYNTFSKKKEPFKTLIPNKVSMYVCGPTVYDFSHIGHARAYIVFDVIYRHLLSLGFDVHYVRNLTDIDDKIIKRAVEEGSTFTDISKLFTKAFHEDMSTLGVLDPNTEPKATEHIEQMIEMITDLISKDHAYVAEGDVFFAVDSFSPYGGLSGKNIDDLRSGARVEVNARKKNPLDFALWKNAKKNEPSWQSPWGNGRPGWHIECSAMSHRHLGSSIDIHGGGKDLVFPHHENEKAQSEASSGKQFVQYWIHNGFVNIDQEKMSKSLGNIVSVRHLLERYHPETIRFGLLSSHYRKPIDFSYSFLDDANAAVTRGHAFLQNLTHLIDPEMKSGSLVKWQTYLDAMNDDFNTPKAIAVIFDLIKDGNRLKPSANDKKLKPIVNSVRQMGSLLGLWQIDPEQFLKFRGTVVGNETIDEQWIEDKINERNEARAVRDFAKADAVRDELSAKGIMLEDSPDGNTKWRNN